MLGADDINFLIYLDSNDQSMTNGSYVIRPLWLLVPTFPGCKQGIGGLVHMPISSNFRAIKSDPGEEELCAAVPCQCPTSKELSWIQCSSPECLKWFHIHCVGLLEHDEKPEKWCCGIERFTEQDCFR